MNQTNRMDDVKLDECLLHINRRALLISLGVVITIFIITNFAGNLINLLDTHQAQIQALADQSNAILTFRDSKTAQELLQSIRHTPDVKFAGIYDENENLFIGHGTEIHDSELISRLMNAHEGFKLGLTNIALIAPVLHKDQLLGHIILNVHLGSLYQQLFWQVIITLLAAVLAVYIGRRLLRPLNTSVLTLYFDLDIFSTSRLAMNIPSASSANIACLKSSRHS